MRALITAGGTSEPIDDVRVVTNLSRGRFGADIANALVARGVEVTLLASQGLMQHPDWVDPRVQRVPFGSFADLAAALETHCTPPPDLLFMAAAVSDYSPIPAEGKIRSTEDALVIRMKRNPKLLATLRERCGRATFLVGFKLLSGVSRDVLVDTALGQLRKCRLDLTVANDLQTFGPNLHPIVLVTPEGGAIPHRGSKAEVAEALVETVLQRADTTWCRTEPSEGPASADQGLETASTLLALAQDAELLRPGPDGNISARTHDGLWATPRQVDKASVTPDQLVRVWPDLPARRHRFAGATKPSIDATVAAWLYDRLPGLVGLVHFHDALATPTASTDRAWPCGCIEEAEEIHRTLATAALDGRWTGGDFLLRLIHHGWLLGVTDPHALTLRWDQLKEGHDAHLDAIGQQGRVLERSPVFDGPVPVGVRARMAVEGYDDAWTLWLAPQARGDALGDRLARLLGDRVGHVVVHEACDVEDFWIARGYLRVATEDAIAVLASPATHGRAREAASVCLVDPLTRRVLLGRRKVGAYPDHWAFPGGGVDAGETVEQAGDRELLEETGIRRPAVPLLLRTPIHVGDGQRVWRVTNLAYATLDVQEPTETDELEARWTPLEEALETRPMASGTRTVLRRVRDRLR